MPEVIIILSLLVGVSLVYLILKGRAEWDAFERNEADDRLRKLLDRGNRL